MAAFIGPGPRVSAVRLAQRHAGCIVLHVTACNQEDLYQAMDWLASQHHHGEHTVFAPRDADHTHVDAEN